MIEGVEAIALKLPLRRPVAFSTRRLETRRFVIVRIRASDGIEGVGYTYGGRLIAAAVDMGLGPHLIGRHTGAIDEIWHDLFQESLLLGRRGAVMRAQSAIDIALWDLLGKRSTHHSPACSARRARRYRPTSRAATTARATRSTPSPPRRHARSTPASRP